MTRVGILSLAHLHAESYLPILQGMASVEVAGISDEDSARGRDLAARSGARLFPSHEALLAEGLDAAIVCSENARHRELVELAAAAGCHVLCEKQIEASLEDAEAMRAACERAGVSFMTAFPMRFDPSVAAARANLLAGHYGPLRAVNGINHSEIPVAHRAWFGDAALAGGGAVMDHTPHLVDLLRWTLGAEVTKVFAEVFDPLGAGVDTAGLASITFSDGTVAALDCSWSRPTTYPRWGHLKMEWLTERGLVAVDAFADHLDVYAKGASRPAEWVGYGGNADEAMLAEFISAAREARPPSVTWNDGYQALRVALACYESARTGRVVDLA
ncbi:MAG TPA: Gfo/Idh/MocA family oxidoreductase [Deinococcales bacterium]|nr:Gfo/Idh/MocA family oxidoreductase [Deinococcales bacterium]